MIFVVLFCFCFFCFAQTPIHDSTPGLRPFPVPAVILLLLTSLSAEPPLVGPPVALSVVRLGVFVTGSSVGLECIVVETGIGEVRWLGEIEVKVRDREVSLGQAESSASRKSDSILLGSEATW